MTQQSNRACPACGGRDRFYFITQPNRGKPYWRCRVCNHTAPDTGAMDGVTSTYEATPRTPGEIAAAHYAYTVVAERCADALWQPQGLSALAYLRSRGLTDRTIRAAQLGWCGDGAALFVDLFYQDKDAYDGALIGGLRKRQGIPCLVLRQTITIPYYGGETCVLLRGRVLNAEQGTSKYLSPAGPLYAGGTPLWYGHRHIANTAAVIVTEGEFKALIAWQEWRTGRVHIPTIASSGVQYLPRPMIQALRGKTVYLAYDNEMPLPGETLSPADQALYKNGAKLRAAGVTVKVIALPRSADVRKVDLDSYILANH